MSTEETMKEKREAIAEYEKSRKINSDELMDNFYRISKGEKPITKEGGKNPTGLIDTSIDDPTADYVGNHIDFSGIIGGMGDLPIQKTASAPKQNIDLGDLSPIVNSLASFKFSSNRHNEIDILREALQEGINRIHADRGKVATSAVMENTTKVSSGAQKFFRIKSGGIRCEFSLLNQKYSMLAMGQFRGNEVLCWSVDGNDVSGHVMRYDHNNGRYNSTDNEFQTEIKSGWKK
jgi:hypothetical protein